MNLLAMLLTVPPMMVFLLFIVPLWLILRYRSANRGGSNLNNEELNRLAKLTTETELIKQRIAILEAILDKDYPNWRK